MDKKKVKMYKIVSNYDTSGLDRKSYSAQHGITLAMFCYWRGKWLAEQEQKHSTTHVKSTPTSPKATIATASQSSPAFVPFEVETSKTTTESAFASTTADLPKPDVITNASTTCEITYPNGVQLKLHTVDLRLLRELLRLDV